MIVVDTNIIAYRLIRGDKTRLALQARERDPDWVVPSLSRHEFLNVLAVLGRQGVLSPAHCARLWAAAEPLLRDMERPVDMAVALALALGTSLTAYDAQYVALAESLGVRCLTEDRGMLRACPRECVSLRGFCAAE